MKSNWNTYPIHVLCFDFDGTVADTMPFLSDLAVNIICKYYHVAEVFAKDNYVKTTGLPFEQQIHAIFPENRNNSKAIQEFEELKEKNYLHLKPVQNVKEVLSSLKRKGYAVAISSSTRPALLTEYVKTYQLPCDLTLGYQPNFRKGQDHFDRIVQTFQVNRQNLCYIGDSLNDYRLATMNQIQFIAKIGLFSQEAFDQLDQEMTMIHQMEELLLIF